MYIQAVVQSYRFIVLLKGYMASQHIYYGIPTYNRFDRTREAIDHIMRTSTIKPTQIVIIDNSEIGAAVTTLLDLTIKYSNVHIIPRTHNILAGAWNDIMNLYHDDYTILANDDVLPHPGAIEALITTARENPKAAIVNGSGHSGNSYSFFLLRFWAYQAIGAFDENFKGGYFEDNDFDRRKDLLGLERIEAPFATFDHVGSATIKAMTQAQMIKQHERFRENEAYFIRKWGDIPARAYFKKPFEKPVHINLDDD